MSLVTNEITTMKNATEYCKNGVDVRPYSYALSLIDGTTVYNRELVLKLHKLATDAGIMVQFKQTATGGNDAGAIHLAAGGVPTLSVSVPARYIHSPSSVISLSDYEAVRETARLLIREVDNV